MDTLGKLSHVFVLAAAVLVSLVALAYIGGAIDRVLRRLTRRRSLH